MVLHLLKIINVYPNTPLLFVFNFTSILMASVKTLLCTASINMRLLSWMVGASHADGFMAVFHIILWIDAVILHPLFIKKIYGIGFLQQGITDILRALSLYFVLLSRLLPRHPF